MVGIAMGEHWPWLSVWLGLGAAGLAGTVGMVLAQRLRAAAMWGLLTLAALGAAWQVVRVHYTRADSIARYVGPSSQLAKVAGWVVDEPRLRSPVRGGFGRFNYESPATLFTLEVEAVEEAGRWVSASGRLLVRIDQADHRIQAGQRIQAAGWLGPISGPRNPGERDYREFFAQEGVVGRLVLPGRGNWRLIDPASSSGVGGMIQTARRWSAEAMLRSLRLGIAPNTEPLTLLEALLLGRWGDGLTQVYDDFRRTGLAHVLSISGAHLAILMGLVWCVLRLALPEPSRAAAAALAILLAYLMALPMQVPILRAAIMIGLFFVGYMTGRRISGLATLSLAAIIMLLWRPQDLFSPGFQLSFGLVAAMLAFTGPVAQRLWPTAWEPPGAPTLLGHVKRRMKRWSVNLLAVNIVAFLAALPLVAYHFLLISPLAIVLSILTLPLVTAILGLGYLKMLLGLVAPSVSVGLGGLLAGLARFMLWLVDRAANWPGVAYELSHPPSVVWVLAAYAVLLAWWMGWFDRRRLAACACGAILLAWGVAADRPDDLARLVGIASGPPLRLNMLAVGDGSCYLLRLSGPPTRAILFDCGSQSYWEVGRRSIAPALKRLNVRRIDTLIVSHADLDHFSGTLDLLEQVPADRVLVPPQLLREAAAEPHGATAYLVDSLRSRGVAIEAVGRGWRQRIGEAELELLWPPSDLTPKRANDSSLVLSVRVAGRRVLLNGDIQEEAIESLLASGVDLAADVTDLPHHGGWTDLSPRWLEAVRPRVVLQSCGPARLERDPWAPLLERPSIQRFITARHGMVEITIDPAGRIGRSTFLDPAAPPLGAGD